ncbi:MAG: tetratricopeptide repeat protein [Spirochaetaceae bacterium]|jgi:tetratricopeptide (TPR) repeat protein|nr:tetratricopeptide repeat protein [Spirochaetaceae bacterium]
MYRYSGAWNCPSRNGDTQKPAFRGGAAGRTVFLCALLAFAAPLFSQTDALTPDALRSYRIGRDMEARGRMEDANAYYDEAVRICISEIARNAANMDSYTVLTWTLQRQGKYADVISWGERGLQLSNDYRVVETMGEAYFYLSNFDNSLRFMQRYVNALPQGERASVAYFFIGEIYRLQKKFQHADIAYTTAVRLEPNMPLWWFRLGSVREAAGEFALAIEAYEQALRLNPNYREATEGLARSRRGNG